MGTPTARVHNMNRSPRRSATQWQELVSEYDAGAENERDFCKRRDLKLVTLRKWRYRFNSLTQKSTVKPQSPFVKIDVNPSRTTQDAVVLCMGPDVRLECPASFDVTSLAQLVLAVHHGR